MCKHLLYWIVCEENKRFIIIIIIIIKYLHNWSWLPLLKGHTHEIF